MLFYALVSRGKTVLAENTGAANTSGNFEVIARVLLAKLDENETQKQARKSIDADEYTFHVLAENDLLFVALTDRSFPARMAFTFLADIKNRFLGKYKKADWDQAIAQSFNAEFSGVLSLAMAHYNSMGAGSTREEDVAIRKVKDQLEDVKDVMRTNIDSLLNRGERIELLVDTTERLTQASIKFQESATRLKHQHWWTNKKNQITLFVIFLIVVFLILVTSCGGLDFGSC